MQNGWLKKIATDVNPPPHPLLAVDPDDDTVSLEQRSRLKKLRTISLQHPTRLPPIREAAPALLETLAAHSRNPIVIDGNDLDAVNKKLATLGDVEVTKEANEFFRILGGICDGAGIHWTIEDGRVVLRDGPGPRETLPAATHGRFALFRERRSEGDPRTASILHLAVEPGWGRIVAVGCAEGKGGDRTVCVDSLPAEPAWNNPYAHSSKPALGVTTTMPAGESTIEMFVAVASDMGQRKLQVDNKEEVPMGNQKLAAKTGKTDDDIDVTQHVWPDWPWPSTRFETDMTGWLQTSGATYAAYDIFGQEIPCTINARTIRERVVTATLRCKQEPAYIRVRGFRGQHDERLCFTLDPAPKPPTEKKKEK